MSGTASNACLSLKPIEVPKSLQEGEKFIKWDVEPGTGVPVTVRVDPNGFFLYWIDQNLEMDLLDIACIRDVRTGKNAKIPKDAKLRNIVSIGSQGSLEEKTVTVCHGTDFVNVNFINFCCAKKEIAQLWTEELFALAYNLNQSNNCTIAFLEKLHTKIILSADKAGKILVKNIVKTFAVNKEDKKRVEKALSESGHPASKNDTISVSKFQFEDFLAFYKCLTQREEVDKIFNEITDKKAYMTAAQLVDFLNNTQRDPRLNEILHPYADVSTAVELIEAHEPSKFHRQRKQLTLNGFLRYLMSNDNPIVSHSKLDLSDDMDQPLAHYYINSSHNTYLTGHQITGRSSVEMYRQCLLAGCRCVELDLWNGRTDEPVIVHGYTFVPEINARDVLEAIAETAFKTSDFPVILSFENHCNPRQQAKIANYCREIFGDMLLDKPLESHQLEPGGELPAPGLLRHKIIIKNKKKHHHKKLSEPASPTPNGDSFPQHRPDSPISSDTDSSSECEETGGGAVAEVGAGGDELPGRGGEELNAREAHAAAEISALVNYIQPVHFTTFDNAEKKSKFYEMSSFDEKQATNLLKERPVEFINYNKLQLSRVYPQGMRIDSSNFMPQVFWNAGCQLVALNYQCLDLAMQLNLGFFEYNKRCGYILKPEFMRRKDRLLDPFTESTVDGIIAGSVSVTVISGQFLSERRVSTYVEVDMLGLPADTVRRRWKTRMVPNNGINPFYGETPFLFKKVVLPELAIVRLAAYEESGRFIGHRVLPVVGLRPGYRHLNLRTELGLPLPASLFLHIVVKDYVPDGMSELAEALANPIKYQSELDRREKQLAVLMEESELTTDLKDTNHDTKATTEVYHPKEPSLSLPTAVMSMPQHTQASEPVTPKHEAVPVSTATVEEQACESIENILTSKAVKEKRTELTRKLEALQRKRERRQSTKFYVGNKLVKRLSSKNISEPSGSADEDNSSGTAAERNLRVRYLGSVYVLAEKCLAQTHRRQLKELRSNLETDTREAMRRLEARRREDVKALSKLHKDREELERVKRELNTQVVERGVSERMRLSAEYEAKREALARAHDRERAQLSQRRKQEEQELDSLCPVETEDTG